MCTRVASYLDIQYSTNLHDKHAGSILEMDDANATNVEGVQC